MAKPFDPFDLDRFIQAQKPVYDTVLDELKIGQKRSHWMWFIFPQIEGLGRSAMAQRYAIKSLDEAKAYLAHPILGPRLTECTQLVLELKDLSIPTIFGNPDDLKFHSCMTLFAWVAGPESVFVLALRKYFQGRHDSNTVQRLGNLIP